MGTRSLPFHRVDRVSQRNVRSIILEERTLTCFSCTRRESGFQRSWERWAILVKGRKWANLPSKIFFLLFFLQRTQINN